MNQTNNNSQSKKYTVNNIHKTRKKKNSQKERKDFIDDTNQMDTLQCLMYQCRVHKANSSNRLQYKSEYKPDYADWFESDTPLEEVQLLVSRQLP